MTDDEVLSAPDPDRPEAFFHDGSDTYLVSVLPQRLPNFLVGTRNTSGFGAVVMGLVVGMVAWLLGRRAERSKVVISRRRATTLGWFQTVAQETFPDEATAELRRQEILTDWNSGAFRMDD